MSTAPDRLLELQSAATRFYRQQLARRDADAARAGAVLDTRGVPDAARNAYELGYAPAAWTRLTDYLRRGGATDAELVDAGLGLRTSRGTVVDRFRDRIMLPVRESTGSQVVAFLGRRMDDRAHPEDPKYLNSPGTALWRKGGHLYGLGARGARTALAKGADVALVEGPLDVIAASGTGRYVGAALTAAQVQVLADTLGDLSARRIVTAFDADESGRQAAHRAYELLRGAGAWPRAAVLPAGHDPASLAQAHGAPALAAALDGAAPLADLVVDARMDRWREQLRWPHGRVGAVRVVAPLLAAMPPEHVGRQVARLAAAYGLDVAAVTEAVVDALSPIANVGSDAAGGLISPERGARPVTRSPPAAAELTSALHASFSTPLASSARPTHGQGAASEAHRAAGRRL